MTPEKSKNISQNSCPKCSNAKNENDKECSKCGIIYDRYEKIQQRKIDEKKQAEHKSLLKKEKIVEKQQQAKKQELNKEKLKQKRKNKVRGVFKPSVKKVTSILLIVIISTILFLFYSKNQSENDYIQNLRLANSVMALSTIKCIEMSEKYSTVWREAINNKYDDDFNDNIRRQRWNFERSGDIDEINRSKELAENLLQQLNQPNDLYPEAHRKIVALYGVYSQIHSLAQSPSGSLMSYNKQVNDLQSEYIRIINEIKVLLPKEEK